jgi:hypothetical protein
MGSNLVFAAGIAETLFPDLRFGFISGIAFIALLMWYNLNFFKFWGAVFKFFLGIRK